MNLRTAPRATPTEDGTILEATNLSAGYHKVPVIHDISMRVRAGEVLAILGANGAGKTSSVLALAGAIPVLGGAVRFGGQDTTAPLHQRVRRGMRLVAEGRSVFMGLTASENLKLARRNIGPCLELFPELKAVLNRRAGLLSGGEQQMLTLSRALASDPAVLLVDELSLGLAPLVVRRLLDAVRAAADRGAGVVLIEQQMRHALAASDRACVMRQGRIVLSGPSRELLKDTPRIEALYLGGE